MGRKCSVGGERAGHAHKLGESVPVRGNSKCKGPEMGLYYIKEEQDQSGWKE